MCTATFLRLPEEKRNRVLDAAWDEFSSVPFARASVNQIIRRAGIPRGSFYQYFQDKSDLFSYLLDSARERSLQYGSVLREAGGDLFNAALLAYDRFLERRERGDDPLTDRVIRVMEINPRIDMEAFLRESPELCFEDNFAEDVNPRLLRRGDRRFLRRVFRLTVLSLGGAILDTLIHPEKKAENREELRETLDIIRRGAAPVEEGGAQT